MTVPRRPRAPARERLLSVSLHDVAPQTWPACAALLDLLDAVAAVPVTLLVVPDYHHHGLASFDAAYRAALERRLARGDELALHGWTHLDEMPLAGGLRDRLQRTRLTAREGEFAALPFEPARARLQDGLDWFESKGWPVQGFVAPAWLLGSEARRALTQFPFAYTTTRTQLQVLPGGPALPTCTFVYSARSGWRRGLSMLWNAARLARHGRQPVVRIALHPGDAAHPRITAHVVRLLQALLPTHEAVTKAELARRCAGEDGSANRLPAPGALTSPHA